MAGVFDWVQSVAPGLLECLQLVSLGVWCCTAFLSKTQQSKVSSFRVLEFGGLVEIAKRVTRIQGGAKLLYAWRGVNDFQLVDWVTWIVLASRFGLAI